MRTPSGAFALPSLGAAGPKGIRGIVDEANGGGGRLRIAVADDALVDIPGVIQKFARNAEFIVGPVGTAEEITSLTAGADGLIVSLHPIREQHIAALSDSVKIIARAGVGLDSVDIGRAEARRVRVVYQPNYATNEVADHAAAMALAAWRRLTGADRMVRSQGWASATQVGPVGALQDSTLGVLGTGRIGRAFIRRLQPFVAGIVVFDMVKDLSLEGVEWSDDVSGVLAQADLLSLHLPLTEQTRHIVDAEAIDRMPDNTVIVNVSRGGLIDERALANALNTGKVRSAALDVFESEPLAADSPLREAPNILLTPHLAWYSIASGERLAHWSVGDVISYLTTGELRHGAWAWQ